jgi:ABC-type multidrug transport system ATPase subunit
LTFDQVQSPTDVPWKLDNILDFLDSRLLITFDAQFNRTHLIYELERPNFNTDMEEFKMHFLLCSSFKYWTGRTPIDRIRCDQQQIVLQTFQINAKENDFIDPTNAMGDLNNNAERLGNIMCILVAILAFHFCHQSCDEIQQKGDTFLLIHRISSLQKCSIELLYMFTVLFCSYGALLTLYDHLDLFNGTIIWPFVLVLLPFCVAICIDVQLVCFITKRRDLARHLIFAQLVLGLSTDANNTNHWMTFLMYMFPAFSVRFNWNLTVQLLKSNPSVDSLLTLQPNFWNMHFGHAQFLTWTFVLAHFALLWCLQECWPVDYQRNSSFSWPWTKCFKRQKNEQVENATSQDSKAFQQKTPKTVMSIQKVSKFHQKVFSKKQKIINQFSFDVFEKQITALLGFNGAGKTTLIEMICGIRSIDGGHITVSGHDVQTEATVTREKLGFCPQDNVFYDRLTVRQNLKLASFIEGVSWTEVNKQVMAAASLVKLENDLDKMAKDLSGSMKRRLCVGCAIVGRWDVLILDQPTSGLDPETRRDLWDLLLQLRKLRTILLTTHSMQEADVLADRFAIMSAGSLVFAGSALQTGYVLALHLLTSCNRDEIMKVVRQFVPGASVYTEKGQNLNIQLIDSDGSLNQSLAQLFRFLESDQGKKLVDYFNLTNTSLEDVFLQLAKDEMNVKEGDENAAKSCVSIEQEISKLSLLPPLATGLKLLFNQAKVIFHQRFILIVRNRAFLLKIFLFIPFFAYQMSKFSDQTANNYIKPRPSYDVDFDLAKNDPTVKAVYASDSMPENVAAIKLLAETARQTFHIEPIILQTDPETFNLTEYLIDRFKTSKNKREFAFAVFQGQNGTFDRFRCNSSLYSVC